MTLDVATAAFAVAPLLFIAIPQPERKASQSANETDSVLLSPLKSTMWTEFREALVYLLNWRGLMLLTGVGLVAKLALTPAASLIPILVTQHFGGGAGELATGEALLGVGIITGGLMLGIWGGFKRNVYTMLSGIMLLGLAMLSLGLLPSNVFPAAVIAFFITGASVSLVDGPFMAIMQRSIAPEMQGRVFTLFTSLISLSSPVGLAIAGPFTDFAGIQTLYIIAGVLMCGMGIFILLTPSMLRIEDHGQAGVDTPRSVTEGEALFS